MPWDAAFFTLADGVLTPLGSSRWAVVTQPTDLPEVQQAIVRDRAAASDCGGDACSGGGEGAAGAGAAAGSLGGVASSPLFWTAALGLGVLGAGVVLALRPRPRLRPGRAGR